MSTAGPTFVLERNGEGRWQGNFYGGNRELVWWTENYVDREDAEHAVELLRNNAATAPLTIERRT